MTRCGVGGSKGGREAEAVVGGVDVAGRTARDGEEMAAVGGPPVGGRSGDVGGGEVALSAR